MINPHQFDALASLPELSSKRLAVRVTPDALRHLRSGHPWVYDKSIRSVSDTSADPGTLAVVFDDKRKFAGIGLWDPLAPMRVRVLHAGKPINIDEQFWKDRVDRAWAARAELRTQGTTGLRVLHGENDGFGGLVADLYDRTLVAKVYSPAWFPHLENVLASLLDAVSAESLVLRFSRNTADAAQRYDLKDGVVVSGEEPTGPVLFEENGLTFEADVIAGQKTGHFLDQRDNRMRVRHAADGKRVLDVFCCTGGFTVNAASGGARSVHSVDLSAPALETVVRNMAHNHETADTRHSYQVGDAFKVLDDLARERRTYDLVIVDPPSFASRARDLDRAGRAYRKLADQALRVLAPGGRLLFASCSSRFTEDDLKATVFAATNTLGRRVTKYEMTGHAVDHPIGFAQGRYLKAFWGTVG